MSDMIFVFGFLGLLVFPAITFMVIGAEVGYERRWTKNAWVGLGLFLATGLVPIVGAGFAAIAGLGLAELTQIEPMLPAAVSALTSFGLSLLSMYISYHRS